MAEQKWEFCELRISGLKTDDQHTHALYEVHVFFFGEGGRVQILSNYEGEYSKEWKFNPWARAMGRLGLLGWELVSVQHATALVSVGNICIGDIAEMNCVAYFKRPVQPGRKANEPELVLD